MRLSGVFVAGLAIVTAGAETVAFGIVVPLGKGLFVGAEPAQPLSSARRTRTNRAERIFFSYAKMFFIEEMS
jgi:hypothetical protein